MNSNRDNERWDKVYHLKWKKIKRRPCRNNNQRDEQVVCVYVMISVDEVFLPVGVLVDEARQ